MMTRERTVTRQTAETDITIILDPDGMGRVEIATGIAFLDHMLSAFGKHGQMDLNIQARGDLEVDVHHTVEDIGIVLGQALKEAIGDGKQMVRFAHTAVPMDESLATVSLDCGGRGYLVWKGTFSEIPLGGIPGDLFEHFFHSLCMQAGITAHIFVEGRNDHHKCEAVFKAFGVALHQATSIDPKKTGVPSTKGTF